LEPCPTGADEQKACKRRRQKCPAGSSGSLTAAVAAAAEGAAAGEGAAADGVIKGRPEIVEAVAAAVDIKAAAVVDIKAAAAAVDIKVAAAVVGIKAAAVDIKAAAAVVTKAEGEVKLKQKFLSYFLKTRISKMLRLIAVLRNQNRNRRNRNFLTSGTRTGTVSC
jgi:hypothetical protein